MSTVSDLPIYNPVSDGKKAAPWNLRSLYQKWKLRSVDKRVHFIPLIVLLCFIILWIFGSKFHHAGNVSIDEDEYFNLDPIEIDMAESMKETNVRFDVAMLGLAAAPINVSDPEPLLRANPEIAPSSVPVTGVTDLNPGSSASLSFISRRLLFQEGNISIEDEDFNDPVEIKKPESVKETQVPVDLAMLSLATTPINASDPEPPFRASTEIEQSTGRVARTVDLNPGSSASLRFGSPRVLIQEGNVTSKDEKNNELDKIKKPESIKETHSDFAMLSGNASAPQQVFQANTEIAPLKSAGSGHQK